MTSSSMNVYLISLISILLFNCGSSLETKKQTGPVSTPRYEADKRQIADCFIANVEYFRRYKRFGVQIYPSSPDSVKKEYNDYYAKYPGADWDPANFFIPYVSRYSSIKKGYVNSPVPTKEQLTVTIDTIVYSDDSLFCVAFLGIYLHYDEIEGLESKRKPGRKFSAKAVIGYRSEAEQAFDIYPLKEFGVFGFESHEAAVSTLKELYFNKLEGIGRAGSVYRKLKHNHNVGDNGFFQHSPYFQKHESGYYNFQMYKYSSEDLPYQYLKCGE